MGYVSTPLAATLMSTLDDHFARIDVSRIYPPFLAMAEGMIAQLAKDGAMYYATSGFRTFEEQTALYAKGRTEPGGKVTNARAGMSAHQYGLAVDFVRDVDLDKHGVQPTWRAEMYRPLADQARTSGLEPGFYWLSLMDAPHVQLPLTLASISMMQLIQIHTHENGREGVWAFLDGYKWNRNLG